MSGGCRQLQYPDPTTAIRGGGQTTYAPLHDDRLWREYTAAAERAAEPGSRRNAELTSGNVATARARAQHYSRHALTAMGGSILHGPVTDLKAALRELRGTCQAARLAQEQAQRVMELDIQLFEVENKSGACSGPRKPVQQGLARTTYDTWGSEWGDNIQAGFRERFSRLNRENRERTAGSLCASPNESYHSAALGETRSSMWQGTHESDGDDTELSDHEDEVW